MTDIIERLRALPAEWRKRSMNYDTTDPFCEGRAHSLEDCAEDIEEAGLSDLLADYERLRGMEERVKGAVIGRIHNDGGDLVVVTFIDAKPFRYAHGQTVALVPVPGGEGK
jgi:hypothetical protein